MDIEVTLKDFMGSDLTVVNAARVSLDKESENLIVDEIGQLKGKKTIVVITHNLVKAYFTYLILSGT